MEAVTESIISELRRIVGDEHTITHPRQIEHGSRDFYWFSPVLKQTLDNKVADVIVRPQTANQLVETIGLAARERVPITPRGAGTGNYGQAIPLHGGIVISTKELTSIVELTADFARVEAGVILHAIEMAARQVGAELRFFPSTLPTATAGGFLTGGSGGVGSITWGSLWDEGNVLGATVVTVAEKPEIITLTDHEELQSVIHNCGLTCIVQELTLALAPLQPWQQYVVAFDTFNEALRCAETLANDSSLAKRLVTVLEWPIPSFCIQLAKAGACPDGKALVLLHLTLERHELALRVKNMHGEITWHSETASLHRGGIELTDFTWNHTTLWSIKADEQLTYLQDAFDPDRVHEQIRLRKERFGSDIYEHIEFTKSRGRITPQGLSIVRFHSKEALWELMEYCESIGIVIANPHTTYLDEDSRWNGHHILQAKARWDPYSLLNPGHLRTLER